MTTQHDKFLTDYEEVVQRIINQLPLIKVAVGSTFEYKANVWIYMKPSPELYFNVTLSEKCSVCKVRGKSLTYEYQLDLNEIDDLTTDQQVYDYMLIKVQTAVTFLEHFVTTACGGSHNGA